MGITQTDLADKLGTTAATISRLETDGIKISVDWLKPLATILQVPMSNLIDEPSPERIEMLGRVEPDGKIFPVSLEETEGFVLRIPATHPVAVHLTQDHGPFRSGELLVGERFESEKLDQGFGRDCLIGLKDGSILLRRLVRGPKNAKRYCLVPLQPGAKEKYIDRLLWCAPIVMSIRYF
ncbi:MAG: hypothetical protein COA62_11360 [Rhodobiaceae bacterium]|nr:MAG: hypothetical protein COA62_11360 [Rhodobiaceae bacterium]